MSFLCLQEMMHKKIFLQVISVFFSFFHGNMSSSRIPCLPCMPRRLSGHEKRIVAARGAWKCTGCGELLKATYEVDHTIPLWKGGADHIDNCTALCKECHAQKTQREEIERLRAVTNSSWCTTPPVSCTRCHCIVSPYFVHRCDPSIGL